MVDVPSASEAFAGRMGALEQSGKKAAESRGLTTTARSRGAAIMQWCAIAVAAAGVGLALWGVIGGRLSAVPALVVISFVIVLVLIGSFYSFAKHTVLTPEGARELEYLKGVEEFIRVADADRLRMLQSYRGAERRQDGTADVIRVRASAPLRDALRHGEGVGRRARARLLPRAARPGVDRRPHLPYLGVYLSAFTSSSHAAATYTSPSAGTSSSSGGSFGGGFSGGGGGGGFSGGR